MGSWKTQRPFQDSDYFQQRLRLDNLTESDLRRIITESTVDIRSRFAVTPEWVTSTEAALSCSPPFEFHDFLTSRLSRDATIGFLDAAAPFISLAFRQLETGTAGLARGWAHCPFDPAAVISILFTDLARALLKIVGRTMVLELNVARLEGRLAGTTSEERFASFVTQLHDPLHLRALFEEYPVMAPG